MLSGKQHHRSVRGMMLRYEVLTQAFVHQFVEWSEQDQHDNIPDVFWETLKQAYEEEEEQPEHICDSEST